ncbi:DNA-dependent metalloprotease SPRTN [Aplochiton taeniatus]
MDDDFLLAIQLQEQFNNEFEESNDDNYSNQSSKKRKRDSGSGSDVFPYSHQTATAERPLSIVDDAWETLDPIPDVRAMFLEFNDTFFWGKLCGVEVKWSPRMTLCAGVCSYEGRGGLCSIRLSEPLLKLRPRRDLVQTLLHEMIHALLFVTQNNRDRDGHGPEFCKHMERINKATGTKITIYHTFNDEVDLYRQHWWHCNGPCQNRKPYFGYVKRAMNRAPSSLDPWWGEHQRSCGGSYIKVKEPEGYGKKGKTKGSNGRKNPENRSSPFSQPSSKTPSQPSSNTSSQPSSNTSSTSAASGSQDIRNIIPFSGKGFLLGGAKKPPPDPHSLTQPKSSLPLSSPQNASLFSPPAQPGTRHPLSSLSPGRGPRSPARIGSHRAPPSISGVTGGPKPTVKRSVGNTKVFLNINGSPVRIPKAGASRQPSSTKRASELKDATTQRSVQNLFSARTSTPTDPATTLSEPPKGSTKEESGDGVKSKPPTNRTHSPLDAWLQTRPCSEVTTGARHPSGGSDRPGGTRPTPSQPVRGSSAGVGPAAASGKRPWDDRISAHMFDFFQKRVGRESQEAGGRAEKTGGAASGSSSSSSSMASLTVSCPVCQAKVQEAKINQHLDSCLS